MNRFALNLTQRPKLRSWIRFYLAKLISQKITDGGSAILKFKLSATTGTLLHIAPYTAKMPFKYHSLSGSYKLL